MGLPPLNRRRLLQLLAWGGLATPAWLLQRSVWAGVGATTRFLAVADTGSGDANQRAVAQQMALVNRQRPVDLVLLGGDNIYPAGDIAMVQATFEKPYRELIAAGVPFHAVLGNHDIRTANGEQQLAYRPFGMKGRFYSLRQGLVEFFCLDTNVNADWARQLPWLSQSLARSSAPWKVVVGHHPVYSSGFYGNDQAAQRRFAPLFRRYGVALYINGHEHHYERSKPIDGTTYLVVGGGGAYLRPVQPTDQSAKAISRFSFAELEANRDGLTITAWDAQGQRLDRALILPPVRLVSAAGSGGI
jgi:3',5'-cyclic AMP phosphodiesterase CpdA